MTLRPDQLGDKGQRYEIRCRNEAGEEIVVGWSNDPDAFCKAIELHPSRNQRRVIDRKKGNDP